MVLCGRVLMVCLLDGEIAAPTRWSLPSCSRPSRTLRAAEAVARRRAILDRRCARRRRKSAVGAEESLRRGRTKERARASKQASKKVSEKKCQQERKCLRSGGRLENEGTASWHEQRNCTDKEPAMI